MFSRCAAGCPQLTDIRACSAVPCLVAPLRRLTFEGMDPLARYSSNAGVEDQVVGTCYEGRARRYRPPWRHRPRPQPCSIV